MEPGWALALLFWGRNSCMGELPRRVTAALAQNPLSHANPLRRDRMRENVLNYPTKFGTGIVKTPTRQRKPDRGNITPQVTQPYILFMGVAAESLEQDRPHVHLHIQLHFQRATIFFLMLSSSCSEFTLC